MNIFKLSISNMTSRPLSTTLSLILLTLGVGMIALLLQVNRHIQEQMENNVRGTDMVVGAKGSPLQLILSAVYHIDSPTGNISWEEAQKLQKNRLVESTVPLSYGDNYNGYRIVGSDYSYPALYNATVADGRLWEKSFEVTVGATAAKNLELSLGDTFVGAHGMVQGGEVHDDHPYEVVGILNYTNSVLDQLILTPTESVWDVHEGHDHDDHDDHDDDHDSDQNAHDDHDDDHDSDHDGHDDHEDDHDSDHDAHDDHEDDHDSDHDAHDDHEDDHDSDHDAHDEHDDDHDSDHDAHDDHEDDHDSDHDAHGDHEDDHDSDHNEHDDHDDHHDEEQEITAMLVKFRNPMAIIQLPRMINEKTNMQAAVPAVEISRLFTLLGVGVDSINAIALLIMIVSGLSVFVSLYNALRDRQYEMALMRTYGASRLQLVWLVLQEGLLLNIAGYVLGMLASRIGLWLVSAMMEESYHYEFTGLLFLSEELWLLAVAVAIGLLASLIPAIRVFRIDISKTLADG